MHPRRHMSIHPDSLALYRFEEGRAVTYAEQLDEIHLALVHQVIMPQAIPILEEHSIELIVHTGIGGTEDNYHVFGAVGGDVEPVDAPGPALHLPVFGRQDASLAVDFEAHASLFNAEILVLEGVEVHGRARGVIQRLIDPLIVWVPFVDGRLQGVPLTEAEASTRRGFQEFGNKGTSEPDR